MSRHFAWLASLLLCCPAGVAVREATAATPVRNNAIFIHHSIGRGLLDPLAGACRDSLDSWNARKGLGVQLWDHDYGPNHPVWGLSDPTGRNLGRGYGEEFNNTIQVSGYRDLFCTANAARDSLLRNHQLIIFKPGYESGWLWLRDDAELAAAQADYLAMRDFFDAHPEKGFIVVTQPPIHRNATYCDERKDRARILATWLGSKEFLAGRQNIWTFDLFDQLARPDDPADPWRNTLRWEYELDHASSDPHPNALAHEVIGPFFANFIYRVATAGQPVGVPASASSAQLEPACPNPFNPRTQLAWTQATPGAASLTLWDARGRRVRRLAGGDFGAGRHAVAWDGRDERGRPVGSGVYFARLEAAGAIRMQRLVLAR